MITDKQKEIAERLKNVSIDTDVVRQNIATENEYCRRKAKVQKPTLEQRRAEYK